VRHGSGVRRYDLRSVAPSENVYIVRVSGDGREQSLRVVNVSTH
jgi:hypothetical protein